MSHSQLTVRSGSFGGGVAGYREFLLRTEGAADPVRFQLEQREQLFAEFEADRPRPRYEVEREVFLRNLRARRPEPGPDPRMRWLLATAKLNQSERFGVGLRGSTVRSRTSSTPNLSACTSSYKSTITRASLRT